ncbi:hypothetical protein GCM10009846_28510 [Agrococcus versicolor]|uniref:Uncharacterized protein n=1 Tax=Agrococcus versicolor TaxID=501482 RepID=A0ABN3AY34_9MICO
MAKATIEKAAGLDPIRIAHGLGLRSSHAYVAGFASIGLSFTSWLVSRTKPDDSRAQSDRWGIFVGHWAPTFLAIGLALKHEER